MSHHEQSLVSAAATEPVARAVAIAGLAGVALIHLLDAHDTFIASPYKGWLYVGLIVGSMLTAGALLQRPDLRAWRAAIALSAGAFAAFVWSRTVGLPQGADDIGNWWEPLGLASLFVEAAVIAVGASVLQQAHRTRTAVVRPLTHLATSQESGYSSFRHERGSDGWAFGVRSSRKLK